MEFYKILSQNHMEQHDFTKELDEINIKYFTGNKRNSIAIKYNPEKFYNLLKNDKIFEKYQLSSTKQLLFTNQKYLFLINNRNKIDFLKIIDYKLDNISEDDAADYYGFDETEDLNEELKIIIEEDEFNIKEFIYKTKENNRRIIIQKNGIIGFDEEILKDNKELMKQLIDILNFGNKTVQ